MTPFVLAALLKILLFVAAFVAGFALGLGTAARRGSFQSCSSPWARLFGDVKRFYIDEHDE